MKRRQAKSRRVRLRTVGEPEPARRPEPVPIVVEIAADGFVRVFGPRHVRPFVFDRFDIDDDPPEICADLATLADLFHEGEMPRSHRSFYCERNVLVMHAPHHRTPEGDRLRCEKLAVIRGLQEIRGDLLKRQKEGAAG